MYKIAICVIAALNQPVYIYYMENYWRKLISYTNSSVDNVDVFLLFENETPVDSFSYMKDNIMVDERADIDELCEARFQTQIIPGILSKTIFAFEKLRGKYDVFFRTNLSSLIKLSAFIRYVQQKESVCYSGAWVWENALRQDLLHHGKIGKQKSIRSISELDEFEGNTFISGAGYFLSSAEVDTLIENKDRIRYDIVDDVSVGLMFTKYEVLRNFATIVRPDRPATQIVDEIKASPACHIRLQHFPLELARSVWSQMSDDRIWR